MFSFFVSVLLFILYRLALSGRRGQLGVRAVQRVLEECGRGTAHASMRWKVKQIVEADPLLLSHAIFRFEREFHFAFTDHL